MNTFIWKKYSFPHKIENGQSHCCCYITSCDDGGSGRRRRKYYIVLLYVASSNCNSMQQPQRMFTRWSPFLDYISFLLLFALFLLSSFLCENEMKTEQRTIWNATRLCSVVRNMWCLGKINSHPPAEEQF